MFSRVSLKQKTHQDLALGVAFLAPSFLILALFHLYPIIKALDMSLYTRYNFLQNRVLERGWNNYAFILNDPVFHLALKNTLTLVFWVVPVGVLLALFLAFLLHQRLPGSDVFRAIYFLPFITSSVAIALVWRFIFHSRFGVFNFLLGLLGAPPIPWIVSPDMALTSLIILCIWKNLGFNIIILLTGLQSIDERYYEAARVDGANELKIFQKITLPLLSPQILFLSTLSVINTFKTFDEVYVLFNRTSGPLRSSLTLVYYIYDTFAHQYNYGVAGAAVVALFILVLFFTYLQHGLGKKVIFYAK